MTPRPAGSRPLAAFHPIVASWFRDSFREPTAAQVQGWAAISRGHSVLIQAPTGSGKTLAAFLWAINRLMFEPAPSPPRRCRVLYVSPLKALAVDVERNLRAPLAGIAGSALADQTPHLIPVVAIRTGDTPQNERARFRRAPSDILITTPESLYLLLTSKAREALRSVDTLILDEVHALVPTKRGAHLALSIERLERLTTRPLQRIGLSATQRPLDEVARYLGGAVPRTTRAEARATPARAAGRTRAAGEAASVQAESELHEEFQSSVGELAYRPVAIVDAGGRKALDLRIEVPVEDMARLGGVNRIPSPDAGRQSPESGRQPPAASRQSIWSAIYPRLLDLIRGHASTLIFVNNRRSAERLAGALNEMAGERLVRAHHGSVAREQRIEIEEALKAGQLRGLVATSSLELGIDMGAIDLVVQIEAPPSVASGLQRVGRGGHHVDAISHAILFPKFRADLVASAAITRAMRDGQVESTRYPRNPLDVLAQQIVAMAALDPWDVDDLFDTTRRAAPFAELSREAFDGVLDMLSGRYPSDEFAELRPRLTWDRTRGTITAREGARRVAVTSGGTIPDRGLYGVYLAGAAKGGARVGELDEEMVFESRVGEVFVLGASSWRIEEITHDRVTVSPAPGEPGKMPFWHADRPGRPLELGERIGRLVRGLREMPPSAAIDRLTRAHDLDPQAAENLLHYLADQATATGEVPDDRTIVIERCRDELGDWRVCLLSPLGSRVHAPWAMAATANIRARLGLDLETMWTDDGFVVRFPETDEPPDASLLLPSSSEFEHLVISELGGTAHFAARFREAAARALLLPRRRPGRRAPLWLQRKRASDLLAVASRFGSFPILLETYRECLRDDFDMPALVDVARRIERRAIRVTTVDSDTPSPFAASLLFGYVANYLYDGDAPIAERRAQALAIDQALLRDLIGTADLRELLDADVLENLELELQCRADRFRARSLDALHDLLLRLGDLTASEIADRSVSPEVAALADDLVEAGRAIAVSTGGTSRYLAVEHASQYRDALGVTLPAGLPKALLAMVAAPLDDLILRYARTHGPFTTMAFAKRHGLELEVAEGGLRRLASADKVVEGDFTPGGTRREWCSPGVLRQIRSRSLAKLRHQIEPVEPSVLGRLLTTWQGVGSERRGLDALLDAVEHLQGAPLPASTLETLILPARLAGYEPGDLDTLASAGEVCWIGIEPIGARDGRVALYLTDQLPRLLRPRQQPTAPLHSARAKYAGRPARPGDDHPRAARPVALPARDAAIEAFLRREGASYFGPIHDASGGGYPGETVDALWALVWRGVVTNDTFQALRAFTRPPERSARPAIQGIAFRSRRLVPSSAEGRWSLIDARRLEAPDPTAWAAALVDNLLDRYGLLTREVVASEKVAGGFAAIYPVLRAMEDGGKIRRGYFVSGVAATQFARPAALELLRSLRTPPEDPEVAVMAAADPANPYGAILKWPGVATEEGPLAPFTRAAGASAMLVNGALAAFLRTGSTDVTILLPESEPDRAATGRAVARALAGLALEGEGKRGGLLLSTINGRPAAAHPIAPLLVESGFTASAMGYHVRRHRLTPTPRATKE
jgi:ATP-dependent Lhr-like helicase